MNRSVKYILFFVFLITSTSLWADQAIVIPSNQFHIDHNKSIIVSNFDVNYINGTWSMNKSIISLDVDYNFVSPQSVINLGIGYSIINSTNNKNYTLYFTSLPLISINTNYAIVDEPDVLAEFKMIESNQNELVSFVGIQYRGAFSQSYEKKSMEVKFWEDQSGDKSFDVGLLGMNPDDGWNLQAMYNEPMRLRSKTNNDLWRLMHTIYYQDIEPDAQNGISMKYVELFVNGEYRGLYAVGQKVNRKRLKLKKHNGKIRGELYKGDSWGASTFTQCPAYENTSKIWSGYEYKHPKEEVDWNNVYQFVDFVVNADEDSFYSNYQTKFNIGNAVDYYIFLNLLRATDNTGKNIYLAKYSTDEPYFYVPWDLDGTFGIIYDGSQENITNDLLSNGLYKRLWYDCSENGFREKVTNRWNELKNNILSQASIMDMFNSNHNYLLDNGVYEREHIAWPNYTLNTNQLSYMSTWMNNRISFLDGKFNESCYTSSLDKKTDNHNLIVYPNPSSDFIYIQCKTGEEFYVDIYNTIGQLILTKKINFSNNKIEIGNFENGFYYVKFNLREEQPIVKFNKVK